MQYELRYGEQMAELEQIRGRKIEGLLEFLITSGTLISMQVVGKDYERLTVITEVLHDRSGTYFAIDPPRDFDRVVADSDEWQIYFKFNGPYDHLEYEFTTFGGQIVEDVIQLPLPEYVERLQRRRDFRIGVPVGTLLRFEADQQLRELNLINISLGGSFGTLTRRTREGISAETLKKGDTIERVEIILPELEEMAAMSVKIDRATVRRVDHEAKKQQFRYAFEFMKLDHEEQQKLLRFIYHVHRQQLQRR